MNTNAANHGVKFDAWRQYFETSARVTSALDQALTERTGIGLGDYNILLALVEAPERKLRMGELAQLILFSGSRLSYRIKVQQDRGWVTVTQDPDDGRSRWVQLSSDGLRTFLKATKVHQEQVQCLFMDQISEADAETVMRVFQRIELGLE